MVVADEFRRTRRGVLATATAGGVLLVSACSGVAQAKGKSDAEDWVSPPEDLMREHGVLERLLLIYEASAKTLSAGGTPPPVIPGAARLVRRFIEDYHEHLEEEHLFPRFEKAHRLVDLVQVLRAQHLQGRRLTDEIERLAGDGAAASDRTPLVAAIASFVRMYRPHAAREDTVLFPAFRAVVGAKEFHELGERFEDKEHELFGKAGFAGIVEEVAALERTLGIEDLKQFTPA